MDLAIIAEAESQMAGAGPGLSEEDKDFVVQFAFRTGDRELTNKLIDELFVPGKDRNIIRQKYLALVGGGRAWFMEMENLLAALERYRLAKEKVLWSLSGILSAYGIPIADAAKIRDRPGKEAIP